MSGGRPGPACPYVGLAPFDDEHAEYFFGRTSDSAVLAENVLARPVTVFYGASGVGKSSVLNVGLPRALRDLGIAVRIASKREWHESARVFEWLDSVVRDARATSAEPLILVLDQFEEYFLYADAEQIRAFSRALAAVVASKAVEAHLLVAGRDDSLNRLDALRFYLPCLLEGTLQLDHLDEGAVREAIEKPIDKWNEHHAPPVVYDANFAATLIGQLRPKDENGLPLKGGRVEVAYLQLALEKIWEAEGGSRAAALRTTTLTERLKGVHEIARRHVEEVLGGLSEDDRAVFAAVFDRLVTPSGGKILYALTDLAAVAKVEPKRMDEILAPLASGKSRLLRAVEPPGGRHKRGYEILHDILARPILDWRTRYLEAKERAEAVERERISAAEREKVTELERKAELDRVRAASARSRLLVVSGFAIVAVGLLLVALWSLRKAQSESVRAQLASDRAREAWVQMELLQAELLQEGNLPEALARLAVAIRTEPGWSAPRGLAVHLLSVAPASLSLLQHQGYVIAAAFSQDGQRIVTAASDKSARIWDAQTGRPVGQALRHERTVFAVAFSPDGTRIVTASGDNTARIWDARTGVAVGKPLQHQGAVLDAEFSPDGTRIVTASEDGTAREWEAQTGEPIAMLQHEKTVEAASFDPGGLRIVTGSWDDTALIWDARTGKRLVGPLRHQKAVVAVSFSPDGRRLVTASRDKTARVWDVQTGQLLGKPLQHEDTVWDVSFGPKGSDILTASSDKTAGIWDAASGEPLTKPLQHLGRVWAASFSPDGYRVLTASEDRTARLWDSRTGEPVAWSLQHQGAVRTASFSPDGRYVLTGADDYTARVWHARTGTVVPSLLRHRLPVLVASFSPDGASVLTACMDNAAYLWDSRTGHALGTLKHGDTVRAASFSPDGTLLLTASSDHAQVWDARDGAAVGKRLQHRGLVQAAAFSPDGTRVVTASWDKTARVWDARTGEPLAAPLEHGVVVWSASFSPDGGRVVTAARDEAARVWDARRGTLVAKPLRHVGSVNTASFSPDGNRIVTASKDYTARIWDASTGNALAEPLQHWGDVYTASFGQDGSRIVTTSADGTARVWDTRTGQPLGKPLLHKASVLAASFSADGDRIVTASEDKTARVWDARTGALLAEPFQHEGPVVSASFSGDGARIVTASSDNTARVWDAPLYPLAESGPLADLAEAVGGLTVNDSGAVVPLPDWSSRLSRLRAASETAPDNQNSILSFSRWMFSDPWTRTISPLSAVTVPQYICEAIRQGEVREAQRLFPGHPLFRGSPSPTAVPPECFSLVPTSRSAGR